jgi:hypothetical protein
MTTAKWTSNRRVHQDSRYPGARFSEKGVFAGVGEGGGDALRSLYRELLLAFSSFAKLFGFPFSMIQWPHIYLLCIFSLLGFLLGFFGVRIMRFFSSSIVAFSKGSKHNIYASINGSHQHLSRPLI